MLVHEIQKDFFCLRSEVVNFGFVCYEHERKVGRDRKYAVSHPCLQSRNAHILRIKICTK